MTGTHRYPPRFVAPVRVAEAREFLVTAGLPEQSSIFAAAEGPARSLDGRELLQVSDTEDGGTYFIDCGSGEIVLIDDFGGKMAPNLVSVNASPRQFSACVGVLEELTIGSAVDEAEEIAARLLIEIEAIDPSAVRDEFGFWRSLLIDVAIGVYADDDDHDQEDK